MADNSTALVPHICCRDAVQAVEFYQKAFGAIVEGIYPLPDGRLMHASLNIDGARLFVVDEFPEQGGKSPHALGGSPVTLSLHVPDCDTVWNRAVEAGCQVVIPLQDMFWGDRWGLVTDPYGHSWSIATTIKQVSPEELQQAMAQMDAACVG